MLLWLMLLPMQSLNACLTKRGAPHNLGAPHWSGRGDLNPRPHGPDPCALAELRYAPKMMLLYPIHTV